MKKTRKIHLVLLLAGAVGFFAAAPAAPADVVADWNVQMEHAIKTAALSPAVQPRVCAIVSAAVYDSVNGLARQYAPYVVHEPAPTGARQDAAAIQASYTALLSLFPTQAVTFDAALAQSLAQLPDAESQSEAIAQGRAWGEHVANVILALRSQDGLTNPVPNYFGTMEVGVWRSIATGVSPDGTLPAIVPQMAVLTPFAMTNHSQFRPGPPYGLPLAEALASPQYAADLNEVKAIGRVDSAIRTVEQTSLARLWQASSTAELNNCLRQVLPATNRLVDNARLFALANFVAADAIIAGFDAKYIYNFWRPHHAIRFADLDDNPATDADPEWSALILAPRHQEYFSNHSVHSGGFAYSLMRLLGDEQTFTLSSVDYPSFTWTYHHFSEMAEQVKLARIWGGIHYRVSCDVGEAVGRRIADYILDNFLRSAAPLEITRQPLDQTVLRGGTAQYSVEATGTPPLSYQWRLYIDGLNYTELLGETNATLVVSNAQPNNVRFRVVVTDGFGLSVTSSLVRLTVLDPILIATQPSRQSFVEGETGTLRVDFTGSGPLGFQWMKEGQPIPGATGSNLVFSAVQFSDAASYSVTVTNPFSAATSGPIQLTVVSPTGFSRVTNGPVAMTPRQGTGAVWADFDQDGWLDLFAVDYTGANQYYRNDGQGGFIRVTSDPAMTTPIGSLGTSAVDYDNDGFLDLVVSSAGVEQNPATNSLFHNSGDGTFTRVSAGGLGSTVGHFFATDWADYDNDGFVDAVVTGPGPVDNNGNSLGGTNQLWRNNGDGTFSRVTSGPIATDRGFAWGALWFDYDDDGLPDLLTLNIRYNGGWTNYLYHNEGDGNFSRNLTSPIGTERLSGGCEGADWGDYDNDGLLDLFVADSGGLRSHLYHNNGGGSFSNVMRGPMLTPPSGSQPHGASWLDYDNDGYLDLVVVHAYRNVLYRNNHGGNFTEMRLAGFAGDTVSDPYFFNNVSCVDYDNDGFLDLHICLGHSVGVSGEDRPNYLYRNSGNSNGWLEVKCIGTVANRSAIGTRIRVKATIDGETFWQVRELKSSAGWDVAAPLIAHFGLGDATQVETLRVEWPSGTVQELHNVAGKQILPITEPPRLTATQVSGQPQFALKGGRNMTYDIETSPDLATWDRLTTVTITDMSGRASITDPAPPVGQKFYRARSR